MQNIRAFFAGAAAAILFSTMSINCRTKPAAVAVPDSSRAEAQAAEYVSQGDARFLDSHLYGWRQAEAMYDKAYALHRSDATREKLLLTRFLIMTRQMDEDIPDPRLDETVKELCENPAGERGAMLCALAQKYREGIWLKTAAGEPARKFKVDRAWFGGTESSVGAYLYSFCARAGILANPPEGLEEAAERLKDSPLFIYLDFPRKGAQKLAEIEKTNPQFAELYDYMGEGLFQKRRYNGARAYFRKAIGLIPEYLRSLNGLGNVYSFALEDYETAIEYYDAVLKIQPLNTAALFGKGSALHNLGRYEESNAALVSMLETDLWRKGYASANNVNYYQGEGRHLQAYNHYLMKNRVRARDLVDDAKRFLPESEEVNYLSGLLFFEENNLEEAREDFLRVVRRGGSNCSAMRYLGIIYRQKKGETETRTAADDRMPSGGEYDKFRKEMDRRFPESEQGEKRALNYFLSSCDCMEKATHALSDQIKMIPAMDLEESEKVILKGKVEKKLLDYRLSSDSMIESMVKMASADRVEGKDVYVKLMNDILTRIRLANP